MDLTEVYRHVEAKADEAAEMYTIADIFKKAREEFASIGAASEAERMGWEEVAFSFREDEKEPRFRPMLTRRLPNGNQAVWPTIDMLSPKALEHLHQRAATTGNPILKARYRDLLWTARRDHHSSIAAVGDSLAAAQLCQRLHRDHRVGGFLIRAAHLANVKGLLQDEQKQEVRRKIIGAILACGDDRPMIVREGLCALRSFRKQPVTPAEYSQLEPVIAGTIQKCEPDRARRLMSERYSLLRHLKDEERLRRHRSDIADSLRTQAESLEQSNRLHASLLYQEALRNYIAIGDRERVKELKRKSQEVIQGVEAEFSTASSRTAITYDDMDREVAKFLECESLSDSFHEVARARLFVPSYARCKALAEELRQKYPLQALFPPTVVDDGNVVYRPKSAEEQARYEVRQNLGMAIGVNNVFWAHLLRRLEERGLATTGGFLEFFRDSPVVTPETFGIVETGVLRYLEGDWVSAIHVLIPQVERVIRQVLRASGISTTSVTGGRTQETTLGTLLEGGDVQKLLGEDLWNYLDHVLVSEIGYNLRNKVAHGLMRHEDCTKANADLIMHVLVLIPFIKRPA